MKRIKINIDGIDYDESYIITLKTHRAVFADAPSIGNCFVGELTATFLLDKDAFPRNAKVIPYVSTNGSTWTKKSEYYVYSRQADHDAGTVSIAAYDAIYKAEVPFIVPGENIGTWPRKVRAVMSEIASRTGTQIETASYNALSAAYEIAFPGVVITGESDTEYHADNATTMREIAGYVASMHAGNWIIANSGKWKLIQLGDVPPVTNYLVTEGRAAITIGGDRILV